MPKVMQVVNCRLKAVGCPLKTARQIGIAVEELYVNIASYAYAPATGPMTLRVETEAETPAVTITFIDSGVPYDPLQKPDPDLSLSLEERPIGGMGIYMVKKSMDAVSYKRDGDRNVLTIRKQWETGA